MEKSWSKIWKAINLSCTSIVAVAAGFSIWAYLIRPTAKLSAVVEYSDVYWPPTFVNATQKLDELTEFESIRNVFIDPNLNLEDLKTSMVFRKYLIEGLKEFRDSLLKHSGLYRIEVTNQGKRICKGVSVKLPHVCLVEVTREDNNREILENTSIINIGDLKAKESVSLNTWSDYSSKHKMDEIKITHDFGVASIDIRKSVGYIGRLVDKYLAWLWFVLFTPLLLLWGLLNLIDLRFGQKYKTKSKNDEGKNGIPKKK